MLVFAACSGPATPVAPDAPLPSVLPDKLSDTGLYADFASKQLAEGSMQFAPANVLWSDAAVKVRWIQLPPGSQVDTHDMNHWQFPVGTKFFKEFSLDGKRLETRLIWRVADTGNREHDTLLGAYVWDDTESEAYFARDGAENLRGTPHDAPAADTCWRCHVGEAGHVLGFSALQLGDVSALPLSNPPPTGTTFAAPNAAEGYLHANCGHCHNPDGGAWVDSHMILRLDVEERDAATTMSVQTTVGAPLEQWIGHGFTDRIVAGDPDHSAVYYRMSQRTPMVQMPQLATEYTDDVGLALVRTWIQSL
ncbi:MAG: hypothetical protein JWO36_2694 [Myxococcales bacterium]|nr:hypothetical protein [Myxococcales bacterium]